MICFQICIFAYTLTTSWLYFLQVYRLWFAFKFVSLHIRLQLDGITTTVVSSCDLLSNLYLCIYAYNGNKSNNKLWQVVICFQICIFAYTLTTCIVLFFLISRCDLLSNLYLCIYAYNSGLDSPLERPVVICFQICIFAYTLTTLTNYYTENNELWFAFKFVSLHIRLQLTTENRTLSASCDLLSNLYLCIYAYNIALERLECQELWFAFKFVSLHIRLQHPVHTPPRAYRCDLLSNLYLCIYAYNSNSKFLLRQTVVICFQICIFAYTLTTAYTKVSVRNRLWFAFKFVSLHIRLQHFNDMSFYFIVVICFQICIFAYTLTTV